VRLRRSKGGEDEWVSEWWGTGMQIDTCCDLLLHEL
jgi:hypothetical protein